MSAMSANRMIGIRTASWNRAQVASRAKPNAIQSQRDPGRASAATSERERRGGERERQVLHDQLAGAAHPGAGEDQHDRDEGHERRHVATCDEPRREGDGADHEGADDLGDRVGMRQRIGDEPCRGDRVDVERGADPDRPSVVRQPVPVGERPRERGVLVLVRGDLRQRLPVAEQDVHEDGDAVEREEQGEGKPGRAAGGRGLGGVAGVQPRVGVPDPRCRSSA